VGSVRSSGNEDDVLFEESVKFRQHSSNNHGDERDAEFRGIYDT